MTAWAATAIRQAIPDASLFWAVQERCAPVIDDSRLVDTLNVFPRERWKRQRWSPGTWIDQIAKYTALRKHKISVGFDFQGHSKTALCLRLSGCRERYAARATDALASRLNPPAHLEPDGPHEVQLALALVQERIGVAMPRMPMMPELEHETIHWDPQIDSAKPLVTLQTGAGEADKVYPPEAMGAVAKALQGLGCFVASVGGPGDPRLSRGVDLDTVGRASLRQSMALVAKSKLHIAGDTGTGHIASSYGVKTVSIFGRTDPERFRPWGNSGIVLRKGSSPTLVAPEDVVEAAATILQERSVARPH